jgi:benzoyl-CoA-dihydrodiol lyase
MLALPDEPARAPRLLLSAANFGRYPMVNDRSRLASRFYDEDAPLAAARAAIGRAVAADEALALGLVTSAPDDLDWDEEIRLALEERASLSPDALTGMEANLRFGPGETMATRVFGRLSAWQNWIYIRPTATGEAGALKVFGTGSKARFNRERV